MSATGLEVVDKALPATNVWLGEIMDRLGPNRQIDWKILSTVHHSLRDRLPAPLAAHLGAQLPHGTCVAARSYCGRGRDG